MKRFILLSKRLLSAQWVSLIMLNNLTNSALEIKRLISPCSSSSTFFVAKKTHFYATLLCVSILYKTSYTSLPQTNESNFCDILNAQIGPYAQAISDYEDYGAYIDGRDSDLDEFMGMVHENPDIHYSFDEIYDPLMDCGPPTIIEEGQDELFPTLDLGNHPYVMTDELFAIGDDADPTTIKYGGRLRHSTRQLDRPDRGPPEDRRLLVALIIINGKPALTLFDSGCTLECISPGFARVANVKVHQLAKQHSLQLGTVGSRAKFNYGTIVDTQYDQIKEKTYFDVVNIDRYDAIVGTYFMQKNGVSLDFENDTIQVKGKPTPTLSVGEGTAELRRRSAMRQEMKSKEFHRQDNPN
ncbi:hypothetical protein PQX77_012532 [Marasmius sp. AFHP31]|nr:hypothetical protein PQX77_012532 [Marasmius sp. AFHP31]